MTFPSAVVVLEITALLTITVFVYLYWKYRNFPPGPYGLPVIGYVPFLGAKPHVTLRDLSTKYGPIVSVNMGNEQMVIVNDWPNIREVLIKQGNTFAMRPDVFQFKVMFQNRENDIVTVGGTVTKELKRVSTNILKELGMGRSSMETVVAEEVEKLAVELTSKDGGPVEVYTIFFIPLLNIVWRLASGHVFDTNDAEMASFTDAVHMMGAQSNIGILNIWPFLRHVIPELSGYRKFSAAAKKILAYIDAVVRQHWKDAETTDDGRSKDFIHLFIEEIKRRRTNNEDQPPYCNNNLVGAAYDLFVAGIETTDTTLHWSLVLMAYYPEVQRKVHAELDKVLADDAILAYASKTMIPYTEATLCEIQRFSSILPLAVPHCANVNTTLFGYKIPKRTSVLANLWALHHDTMYWGDPDEFRPERFLDEDGQLLRHERYIPFSAGPRVCMGEPLAKMELTLFFSCLLRRFRFQFEPTRNITRSVLEPNVGIVLRLPNIPLIVKRR